MYRNGINGHCEMFVPTLSWKLKNSAMIINDDVFVRVSNIVFTIINKMFFATIFLQEVLRISKIALSSGDFILLR